MRDRIWANRAPFNLWNSGRASRKERLSPSLRWRPRHAPFLQLLFCPAPIRALSSLDLFFGHDIRNPRFTDASDPFFLGVWTSWPFPPSGWPTRAQWFAPIPRWCIWLSPRSVVPASPPGDFSVPPHRDRSEANR